MAAPRTVSLLVVGLVAAGCNRGDDLKISQTVTETFAQVPSNEVDILWVIDDSASMEEEQARVIDGAADFLGALEDSEMDFHIGVTTTNPDGETAGHLLGDPAYLTADDEDYATKFAERVAVGAVTDNEQESGLEVAVMALTAPLVDNENAGFVRKDARLSVIVLSDEDDCSDFGALGDGTDTWDCYQTGAPLSPVDDLIGMLRTAKGIDEHSSLLQISGIIGPPFDENCPSAEPGDRYAEAIEAVGGMNANICATDYGTIMDDLGLVSASLQAIFPLSYQAEPTSIGVVVTDATGSVWDVAEDTTNGWSYADTTSAGQITFAGDSVPPRGSTITVTYTMLQESTGAAPVTE